MTVKRIFGSGPNQIARNKDLGSLAWQNKTGLNLQNTGVTYIVGGSPALPNAAQIGFYDDGSSNGHLEFYTTASGTVTERLRLDSSGNLGLGVTPSAWTTGKAFEVNNAGNAIWGVGISNISVGSNISFSSGAIRYANTAAASYYQQSAGVHYWFTAPSGTAGNAISFTQAMTLDASGQLLVGISSYPTNADGIVLSPTLLTSSRSGTGANNHVSFRNGNGTVGIISTSGTTTTYATSSDYRLKENIQPMQGALAVVQQLNPVTYTWKADGSDGQGFIAHELQAVVPDCVTGEKDAVDEEGKPVYQGIDTSFLVATLTKAIQELKAELDELKAKVN